MPYFDRIIGQDSVKAYMKKTLERHQPAHAYIISGEEGMGKRLLADTFAMALLCDRGGSEPCGTCHSCIQFEGGNHPDFCRVTHEKQSIGVDEIRAQLVEPLLIKPYHSRYKVYLVEDAQLLTVQAQSALLKSIEEPPEYGVIILLTTNPDAFLQTIRSRCTMLKMVPLPDGEIRQYLLNQQVSPEWAETCTAFARGNLGRALDLSRSEDFAHLYSMMVGMLTRIREMDLPEITDFIRELKENGLDNVQTLDFCEMWFRDILYRMSSEDSENLIFREEKDATGKLAGEYTYRGLREALDAISAAKTRLNANVNFDITMELAMLAMKG